jgi:transcriptional regulator with XRE-family HTH domain
MERTHVSRIERGVANPSLFVLANLAYVFKISLSRLFEGIFVTMAPPFDGGVARRSNQSLKN